MISRKIASTLTILIFSIFTQAQIDPQEWSKVLSNPPESTPELRQRTFDEVWQTVFDNHFDGTFGGTDWKETKKIYSVKASETKNNEELAVVLREMLSHLKVSHNLIFSPKEALSVGVGQITGIGVETKIINNEVVIAKVEASSPAEQSGLKQGFILEQINKVAVKNVVSGFAKEVSFSRSMIDANIEIGKLLNGTTEDSITLVYKDEKNISHTISIQRKKRKGDIITLSGIFPFLIRFESKWLSKEVGYVSFSNFYGVGEKVASAVTEMRSAKALILDLRNNKGGSSYEMNAVASLFFDKLTFFARSMTRKGFYLSGIAMPVENNFKGKLIILIDSGSASASEMIAAGFQEIGRATIIGETSAGALLLSNHKLLPNGYVQAFTKQAPVTLKGTLIEGRGVTPNIEIKLTREKLLRGGDAVLESALKFINNNKRTNSDRIKRIKR